MNFFLSKRLFLFFLMLFFSILIYGQDVRDNIILRFNQINDTIIKQELSLFCQSNFAFEVKNKSRILVEIPLKSCDGNTVILEKGNFFSFDKSILIKTTSFDTTKHFLLFKDKEKKILESIDYNIFFGTPQTVPIMKLKKVTCFFNEYNYVDLPIEGIYEPLLCQFMISKKGKKKLVSNNKAFMSNDRKRIYIYMLNGLKGSQYEVTWIIQNGQYYGRVIDKLPNN